MITELQMGDTSTLLAIVMMMVHFILYRDMRLLSSLSVHVDNRCK